MGFFKRHLFPTPWHLIRFFIPLAAAVPFAVYYQTLFRHVYPGYSAFLTAAAARLCEPDDLSSPLFLLVARQVADLAWLTLPERLNLFCAACGSLAVSLFYLFVARLVFVCACEDPGGAMAALPPRLRDTVDDTGSKEESSFALNPDGSVSIPLAVLTHNWRVAQAAVLGGLGAAVTLAFCAPFWLASTRLFAHTFDLMLFFLILNLLFSYDQRERLFSLFLGVFLLSACSLESPLFLLLLPVGGLFLLRALILNEQATTYRVLGLLLVGLAGGVVALTILWVAAHHCAALDVFGPRLLVKAFLATTLAEVLRWIPRSGWSLISLQLLFPSAIAVFVFSHAFHKRTFVLFLLQLALVASLVPSLLNLPVSPWGIGRMTSKVPIFSYVVIALFAGLMVAVWHLMREMFQEKVDDDLDFYEYRDNPAVCRIGSLLCWPLLLLTAIVPIRSYPDVNPREGMFADEVADVIYGELGARDWVVNCNLLHHHLMIRAQRDGRSLRFLSTDARPEAYDAAALSSYIVRDAAFAQARYRLLNAADLSPASFVREWLRRDANAYQRVVSFRDPELWRQNGYRALPTGFFLSGQPASAPVDASALLARHRQLVESLRPILRPAEKDAIQLFAGYRSALRNQLAYLANELAVLLAEQDRADDAVELLKASEELAPNSLSPLLNRYHLAANAGAKTESASDLETRLRAVSQRRNTYALTPAGVQADTGTLINPDILEYVRKNFWNKQTTFRHLAVSAQAIRDPLTALRDKKRELYQSITLSVDTYAFEDAERQLNLLLDLDERDSFALLNKALIAIERRDIPEAGLWMDLAKESGVQASALVWHEAAMKLMNSDLAGARSMLNAALPATPSDIRLWGLLAEILLRTGEYHELENRVYPAMRSAASKREHYLLHVVRGHLFKNGGPSEYSSARASFLRALALNKNLSDVQEEVLKLDDVLDVPAFSEQDAKAVLRQSPDHPFANYLLGTVRLHRGELEKAEDLFVRSLEKGTNAPALAGLGAMRLAKKDLPLAEQYTRQSLALDSKRISTWHTLAKTLLAAGRLEESARALDTVVAQRPDDLSARLTLIRLRMAQRKLEEAALLVSELLENEDLLPLPIAQQLRPLATKLSEDLAQ